MIKIIGLFNSVLLIVSIIYTILFILSAITKIIDDDKKENRGICFIMLLVNIIILRCLILIFKLIDIIKYL